MILTITIIERNGIFRSRYVLQTCKYCMHSRLRDTFSVLPRARWKAAAITISPDFRQLARSRKASLAPCARAAVVSEEIRPFDAAGILTDKEKAPVPNYVRRIRRDKDKNLSLSLSTTFETYASNDETHTLVESKVWARLVDGGWEARR